MKLKNTIQRKLDEKNADKQKFMSEHKVNDSNRNNFMISYERL